MHSYSTRLMSNTNNRKKLQLIQCHALLAALHFTLETTSLWEKIVSLRFAIGSWNTQVRKIKKIPLLEIPFIRNILAKFIGSV